MRMWTSVFFCGCASNAQDSPKASPRVIYNWKNFIDQLQIYLNEWMLLERWRRPSMLSSMCQHVARLQFDSCAEKNSLCGTVMIHHGLNLTCLDQCHGVRFHGTSSSQGRRKRIVVQSKFDRCVSILVFAEGDFCRFAWQAFRWKQAFVDISVNLWVRKQRPRFAQGQSKGYFQMEELDRTTEAIAPMNERWRKLNATMRQFVPLHAKMGQHGSLPAVQRKTAFVEQSWWPDMFV